MALPTPVAEFWQRFLAQSPEHDPARFYEAFSFGDSEALADELADLLLRGIKRATAGSIAGYEMDGGRPPRPGDLSIVCDGRGKPLCVIETLRVEVCRFGDVDAEFAAVEGEGDGSLAYWRAAHAAYFEREAAQTGQAFSEDVLLACERFRLVYREA
ncbi:uncharacterized protein YhfF [Paucibacter oligotrophus]|uniref:Uncharacterized protein YhfF n=1 Tax=Roseateles oligotrophus TaxID=1769250 RepID=A0A840LB48_9BURK|nr:ASCH domain-containing protein [Roseateles oligotrophus]MBB4843872.1 uncharacterized protein YhfF [Roseateles oligotrophus]